MRVSLGRQPAAHRICPRAPIVAACCFFQEAAQELPALRSQLCVVLGRGAAPGPRDAMLSGGGEALTRSAHEMGVV